MTDGAIDGGTAVPATGSGRVGIVTGATRGIGRAMACAMAARGDRVVALGRDPDRLEALRRDLEAATAGMTQAAGQTVPGPAAGPHHVLALDVADPGHMDRLRALLESIGRADVLVASAAVGRGLGGRALPWPTAALPLADWQAMVDVNLTGVFLAARAVLPVMQARGDGDIVSICSSTTPRGLRGTALAPAYAATKFALAEFGRQLAHEVAPDGIRVRTIFPGPVETPLIAGTLLDGPFGGRIAETSFATALLGLLDLGPDADLIEPHVLPVPTRARRTARPAPYPRETTNG